MKQIHKEKAEKWLEEVGLKDTPLLTTQLADRDSKLAVIRAFAEHLQELQSKESEPTPKERADTPNRDGWLHALFQEAYRNGYRAKENEGTGDGSDHSEPFIKAINHLDQEQECVCGEPHASDMIVHRTDGPCYAKPTPSDKAEKFIKNHPDYDYGAYETEVIMKFCEYLEQEHYE